MAEGKGSALDSLKDRPKDEKKVVAGGIAITVVVVLLAVWAIFFFKGLANNSQEVKLNGTAQDEFNFSSVRAAQAQLQQQSQSNSNDELRQIRNDNGSQQMQVQQQGVQQAQDQSGTDQFGTPNSSY